MAFKIDILSLHTDIHARGQTYIHPHTHEFPTSHKGHGILLNLEKAEKAEVLLLTCFFPVSSSEQGWETLAPDQAEGEDDFTVVATPHTEQLLMPGTHHIPWRWLLHWASTIREDNHCLPMCPTLPLLGTSSL